MLTEQRHALMRALEPETVKHTTRFEALPSRASSRRQSLSLRSRRALAITDTELKLIAAPAITGLSRMPK